MTSVPELRPLALGEMVDRAATFWRQNLKALFKLYLPFQLVQYVVLKAYTFTVLHRFPVMRGGAATEEQMQADPAAAVRQLLMVLALLVGMMVAYFLVTWFSSVAGTRRSASTSTRWRASSAARRWSESSCRHSSIGCARRYGIGWAFQDRYPMRVPRASSSGHRHPRGADPVRAGVGEDTRADERERIRALCARARSDRTSDGGQRPD